MLSVSEVQAGPYTAGKFWTIRERAGLFAGQDMILRGTVH